jgi:tol-pal system protein YbgF
VLAFSLAAAAAGCARGSEVVVAGPKVAENSQVEALRAQLAERDQRLNQLESRLALLEAAQREMRYALADQVAAPAPARESVRIGEREPSRPRREEHAESAASEASRPVLRLHEDRRRLTASASSFADAAPLSTPPKAPLMPVPEVDERLPIAPVPSLAAVAKSESEPGAPDPNDYYKRAIDLVRQREFQPALKLLNDFLARFPEHPRAAKVMFWRGEVLFAQRDYAHALEAYESAVAREPRGDKAPDALLKIGLCHRHLGSPERARGALQRLKTQFPDSDAARLVKEEDA